MGTLERVSHHIEEPQGWPRGIKEQVHLYYAATWRGRPVTVTMQADRYTHSEGLSDWRVYAVEAREKVTEGLGANLTDTARSRLSDEFKPAVLAWLASEDYAPSEQRALFDMIRRMAHGLAPYEWATKNMREAIARHTGKLGFTWAAELIGIADAFDAFAARFRDAEGER